MKFFSLTSLALAGSLISPSIAAPTPDNALVVRQTPADAPAAFAIVSQLYTDIKQYTAVINSTAASLTPDSSLEDKAAAGEKFTSAIASINTLVVDATTSIKALPDTPATKRALEAITPISKRQVVDDPTGLAGELVLILLEVGGALNNIIAILGLTATLSFLGPLVGSLSLLLASLVPVVDNLLALVQAILDGLLIGLSAALAGLVL
ncbi:MAG: hypothetical protein L6R41_002138 [Letrouitia leprolyta]|nr:MAG: hypothetical protein L6R41_002138 [Letrouitia leprolyta]